MDFRYSGHRECFVGQHPIEPNTPHKYGYPIPKKYGPSHLHQGAILCLDHWPEFHQAQLDEGLVVYAEVTRHVA